jgi:chemotaxis protein MotA
MVASVGFSSVLGLILGFGALGYSVIMEGGSLGGLVSISAALIVFGGTFGATLTSFPMAEVLKLPKLIMKACLGGAKNMAPSAVVEMFVALAERARKEGLLSLEDEAEKIKDPFVKKGMLLVVDGIDSEVVGSVLDSDISAMAERHQRGYGILEAMGGYAPTMGIIGTVMGLIRVLSNLSDPTQLSEAIAVAFIATLYGVGTANLLWLPLGAKLKADSKEEIWFHEVAREGILAVQAGDNPRIVREKLEAFLSSGARGQKAKPDAIVPETAGVEREPAVAAGR